MAELPHALGVYPGSFNPPTVAHLAVAHAALEQCGLVRVDLVLSRRTLGKEGDTSLADVSVRHRQLDRAVAGADGLSVRVTDAGLLVDIAEGYDVLVVGADKFAQLVDPAWYGPGDAFDQAMARLPHVAVAPRPPHPLPRPQDPRLPRGLTVLEIHGSHHAVSATGVRSGRRDWLAPGLTSGWHADPLDPEEEDRQVSDPEADSTLGRVRAHREALAHAADVLELALAKPAGDARAWTDAVEAALTQVQDDLDAHIHEVEDPDGLYPQLMERSPRLAHRIEWFRRDHTALRETIADLVSKVAGPTDTEQIAVLREQALGLLTAISRHRQAGADLIYDSYDFDIGGEGD